MPRSQCRDASRAGDYSDSLLADLNGAGGLFAFGGSITTLNGAVDDEYLCGYTNNDNPAKLVLETTGAECFLVVGNGFGIETFGPGMNEWWTQVGAIEDFHLVALDDLPEFVLPKASNGPGGSMAIGLKQRDGVVETASTGVGLPPKLEHWITDGFFSVQVVMWNPEVFPGEPAQWSHGLYVRVNPHGGIETQPFGLPFGMEVWAETDIDADGNDIVRFPFSIDGL